MPRPNVGSWVAPRGDYVGTVYACARATCRGALGPPDACWTLKAMESSTPGCDYDSMLCNRGSRGPLCGSCSPGYIFLAHSQQCSHCAVSAIVFYSSFFACLVAFCALALVSVRYGWLDVVYQWRVVNLIRHSGAAPRILWSTYQIISSVSINFQIKFPQPFASFASAISVLSFDFIPIECLDHDSSFIDKSLIYSIAPIVLSILNFAVYVGRIGLSAAALDLMATVAMPRGEKRQHVYAFLLFTYLILPAVSHLQLQALDCVYVAGDSILRFDTIVDCNSRDYQSFYKADIFLAVVYGTVPIVWLVMLYRKRHRLNPNVPLLERALEIRDADEGLRPLWFLVHVYRPEFYLFEVNEMYRRIFFVGVLPLMSAETTRRAAIGTAFAFIGVVYMREIEPCVRPADNALLHVAQILIFFSYAAALVISADLHEGLSSAAFGAVLLMINLFVVALAVWFSLRRQQREQELMLWRRVLTTQEFVLANEAMRSGASASTSSSFEKDGIELTSTGPIGSNGFQSSNGSTGSVVDRVHLLDPKAVAISGRVGAGAFGEVFRGTFAGTVVAVKILLEANEKNLEKFKYEINITASLRSCDHHQFRNTSQQMPPSLLLSFLCSTRSKMFACLNTNPSLNEGTRISSTSWVRAGTGR